jgi:hypothetical protein
VYSPSPTFKAAFQIAAFRQIKDVQISNNVCSKIGSTVPSIGVLLSPQSNVSHEHRNIVIRDNYLTGFNAGVGTFINFKNGMGPVEISNNYFLNCSDATGYTTPQGIAINSGSRSGTYSQSATTVTITINDHGFSNGDSIYIDFTSGGASSTTPSSDGVYAISNVATNTFDVTLVASLTTSGNVTVYSRKPYEALFISNNTFIDDRAVKQMDFGIRVDLVVVTNLNVQRQKYLGMVTGNYAEASTTVTNRFGYYEFISFTPTWKAGGVAVTLGNGSLNASYTVDEKQVTINAFLSLGSTTSIGAGAITLDLPFTTNANSLQYIGNWRIFDTSLSTYYFGGAVSVNNDTGVGLQLNNGGNVTNSSPVTLATGDLISLQMTYTRA